MHTYSHLFTPIHTYSHLFTPIICKNIFDMSLISVGNRSLQTFKERKLIKNPNKIEPCKKKPIKKFFLDYQWRWITDTNFFCLCEKSRRTGITFSTAFKCAVDAIKNERDTYYTSYNIQACREYIRDCARFLRAFNTLFISFYGIEILNESNITAYQIVLNNGRRIEAIPGNPVNLRGKDNANIILDEFAFRISDDSKQETMKAVMAYLIWMKSRIYVISTHNGEDDPFNELCQKVKSGEIPGSHHKITFQEAIKQGLYKKVCEFADIDWTKEGEQKYIKSIYDHYGEAASEELDVIPRKYGRGNVFKYDWFKIVNVKDYHYYSLLKVRYFDLASSTKANSFFTATIKLVIDGSRLILIDAQAERLEASDGNDWIENIIKTDTGETIHLIEREPGSSELYIDSVQKRLPNHYIQAYKPDKDKVLRALPAANAVKRGKVVIANKPYFIDGKYIQANELINILCKFGAKPEPLITDLVDCLSGAYDYAVNQSGMYYEDYNEISTYEDSDFITEVVEATIMG